MTKRSKKSQYADIDIHDLLKHRRQIAMIWGTEDVQTLRPDLTENQAWEVLQHCQRRADCDIGINWLVVDLTADELFPPPDDGNA